MSRKQVGLLACLLFIVTISLSSCGSKSNAEETEVPEIRLTEISNQPDMVGELSLERLDAAEAARFKKCLAEDSIELISIPFSSEWRLQVVKCIESGNFEGRVGIKVFNKTTRDNVNVAMLKVVECLKSGGYEVETIDRDGMVGWKPIGKIPKNVVEACEQLHLSSLDRK